MDPAVHTLRKVSPHRLTYLSDLANTSLEICNARAVRTVAAQSRAGHRCVTRAPHGYQSAVAEDYSAKGHAVRNPLQCGNQN